MDKVLEPVKDCSAIYIDDVIIFSSSWEAHLKHLAHVFQQLRSSGLKAKLSKCSFGKAHIEYLGHMAGSGNLAVPEHRVSALANYKRPITKRTLRLFLGCASYYRKFIEGFARLSSLLTLAMSMSAPKVVEWSEERLQAFEALKVSLCNHVTLHIPSLQDSFVLYTDASGRGIGACLHIKCDSKELPVAFYSRQLLGAESNYSITELKTLAIIAAVDHFQFYIYGTSFKVVTDHKACTSLLTSNVLNKRLRRMALRLQGSNVQIMYKPGSTHSNADGLSRQIDDNEDTQTSSSSPTAKTKPRQDGPSPLSTMAEPYIAGGCGITPIPPQ